MFKTIKLPRVTLRLITHKHGSALLTILNNPLVYEFNDYKTPLNKDHIKQLIQDDISGYYEGEVIRLAIEHNMSGKLLGTCGLYKICKQTKSAYLGFELDPFYWQQGLMQEVLRGFMSQIPSVLKIEQLYAEIHGHNVRSYNLLTKLGFVLNEQLNNGIWHKQLTKMDGA
ncbi:MULTISPECIES: GNAT family N-acetyltransferase [unclassified Pseudoalteromonas]|uniref:GNAT family N-acetyltransferase n=1 Tax=unclassified Pseudoalteromonas TaxID=194690 RepID=UPI00048C3998|nr:MULTISPECIES: GNAT family N-acetyltransferase [unclassified Pseudoalteromonas]